MIYFMIPHLHFNGVCCTLDCPDVKGHLNGHLQSELVHFVLHLDSGKVTLKCQSNAVDSISDCLNDQPVEVKITQTALFLKVIVKVRSN